MEGCRGKLTPCPERASEEFSPIERNDLNKIRLVVIGSGNVATALATAFDKICTVEAVWSRHIENARELSSKLRLAKAFDNLESVPTDADFYIVAVSDRAVRDVYKNLPKLNGIVASTSGTVSLDNISDARPDMKSGVFYPLQTFTKGRTIDLGNVPFLIEANDERTQITLIRLASLLSSDVRNVKSAERRSIHVAAVLASNFANHLWAISDSYLREHTSLDISLLEPLLKETLEKAMTVGPREAQTGPARRHDTVIIESHLSQLPDDVKKIYRLMSESIMNSYPIEK